MNSVGWYVAVPSGLDASRQSHSSRQRSNTLRPVWCPESIPPGEIEMRVARIDVGMKHNRKVTHGEIRVKRMGEITVNAWGKSELNAWGKSELSVGELINCSLKWIL